jgi:phage terminase large subunit-like protein
MVMQTITPDILTEAALRLYFRKQADPWRATRRPNQAPPDGDWRTWLVMAGRGFGKTRMAAEWVREQIADHGRQRIALVGATAADVRDVMVDGESGLLACCERYGIRATYQPSRRRVLFPNGAMAFMYSADEPNRLRGPQHDAAWGDEPAAWRYPEAYENLDLGLRLGDQPQMVLTTTPRPVTLVRTLVKRADRDESDVAVTRGRTIDNAANLSPGFMAAMHDRYHGTRLGRQELEGELLEDVEGALWTLDLIDAHRMDALPDGVDLVRCVVGIDPAATSNRDSNETGIIVAGLGSDGDGYVLADSSLRGSPNEWGGAAVQAYRDWQADHVTPETNNGGEMVIQTLRTVDPNLPIQPVHASRGKATRAEPIAALYEQGRVHHVGTFPELEDQMATWVPGMLSPDRMDALVWALTDVMLEGAGEFTDLPAATVDWLEEAFG